MYFIGTYKYIFPKQFFCLPNTILKCKAHWQLNSKHRHLTPSMHGKRLVQNPAGNAIQWMPAAEFTALTEVSWVLVTPALCAPAVTPARYLLRRPQHWRKIDNYGNIQPGTISWYIFVIQRFHTHHLACQALSLSAQKLCVFEWDRSRGRQKHPSLPPYVNDFSALQLWS